MFNLKKYAKKAHETGEKQLEKERRQMGTAVGDSQAVTVDHMLDDLRKETPGDETTELQLDDERVGEVTDGRTTDGQLGHHKSPDGFVPTRENTENRKFNGLPINDLAEARDQEKIRAFKDAETIDGDTSFWDKTFSDVKPLKAAPSQLHNAQDRVSKLTPENVADDPKLKEMVMASLKDADAMLYHIYSVAARQSRELNKDEAALVDGITRDKVKMATVLGV
jgi:hypothetical protein